MSRLLIHPDLHTKFKSRGTFGAAALNFIFSIRLCASYNYYRADASILGDKCNHALEMTNILVCTYICRHSNTNRHLSIQNLHKVERDEHNMVLTVLKKPQHNSDRNWQG